MSSDPATDAEFLRAVYDAYEPRELVVALFNYYHDADRGDRTSRQMMYLHMGMLSGTIMRMLQERARGEPRKEEPIETADSTQTDKR